MNHHAALEKAHSLLHARSPAYEHLVERITQLLATNPEQLLHILYRVDVSQERVTEIFRTAAIDRIAAELASALLERLEQKLSLRQWYSQHHTITQVRLRPYAPSDALALFDAVVESFDDLHRWLAWCRYGYSLEDAQSWCTSAAERFCAGTHFHYAVEAQIGGQWIFAGGCGITPTADQESRVALLGYWTRSSLAGQSIATRAAHHAIEHAFGQLGIERVEIIIATPNKASQRVAEKLGATREALLRSRIAVGDGRYDAFLYSILRAEWKPAAKF